MSTPRKVMHGAKKPVPVPKGKPRLPQRQMQPAAYKRAAALAAGRDADREMGIPGHLRNVGNK